MTAFRREDRTREIEQETCNCVRLVILIMEKRERCVGV